MYETLQNGYIAEEAFILTCLKKNIEISRPIFNVEAYDFVIRVDKTFYAIQVKKATYDSIKKRYTIHLKRKSSNKKPLRLTDFPSIDYFAVYIMETDEWYIIPVPVIDRLTTHLIITPKGKYTKYKENWNFGQEQELQTDTNDQNNYTQS